MLKDLLKVILVACLAFTAASFTVQVPEVPTESADVQAIAPDDAVAPTLQLIQLGWEVTPDPQPEPEPEPPQSQPVLKDELKVYVDLMIDYQPELDEGTARQYAGWVVENCQLYGLDPIWIIAMMWQESRFLNDSVSSHGAIGLMQILPSTARGLGYTTKQIRDPQLGIEAGVGYLATLKENHGDIKPATTAYNQGSARVRNGTARMWYYNDIYNHYTDMKGWIEQHG